ncbi:hypothetical protein JL721_3602 [Aureococcus anophagefferens]|nr:hypothetical protein JL721_3602 [Aureococcus anophagefferens]
MPPGRAGSGEAAFRRWWADGRHLSSADAFEHSTIADAGAKYAAVLFGMVRTWRMSRKMFQRTFLGPNGPMDLFFEVYAQDEAEVDLVASTILRLPRRRVHVERWGAPIMERLRTDHRVTVCADAPRRHEKCVEADTKKGRSGDLKAMISKARKVELGWRMLEAHVAADRGGVDYDAVLLARTDLSYPPQPFDMARAAAADALLIPAGADMPLNDQFAVGRPRWLRAYATAYSYCIESAAARALYGKAVPIGDHFCGKLERSLVPAIRSRVPDDKFRRFWFQYWIVRGYQIPYFEEHHDFAYRTWGSPCCWQRLNWAQPAMSLNVLVDLNTTCLVDPNVLGKHGKKSVRWPRGRSVDLLKCRFAGSYCDFKKYPSSCKDGKGPPPGPRYYLPEELPSASTRPRGKRATGTTDPRIQRAPPYPSRRDARARKRLAELDTQGAKLAEATAQVEHRLGEVLEALNGTDRSHGTDATTAPPPAAASRPAKAAACAAPPGGGNATVVRFGAVDESGLRVAGRGWGRVVAKWRCAKQMKIAVLGGSMTWRQPREAAQRQDQGLARAAPFEAAVEPRRGRHAPQRVRAGVVPGLVREPPVDDAPGTDVVVVDYSQNDNRPTIEDAREGGAAVDELDHDGLWPAGELLGNARLDGLWRAPAAKGGDVDHHPGVPAHEFVAGAAHAAVLALVRRAERGDGAVVPDWAPAGGTLASANELAELSACSLGMAAHHVAADIEAAASPGAEVRAGGGWSLRRDREGKPPGWIVNATATATSELAIVVPCGVARTVGLEYLRSYEGMGSVTATFATIDVEKIKFNELICAGDDECAAYAAAPGSKVRVSAVDTVALNATWPQAESLAVVRQFKVACHNHDMVWNPVVVKLRPDPGDRGKFKLLSVFAC